MVLNWLKVKFCLCKLGPINGTNLRLFFQPSAKSQPKVPIQITAPTPEAEAPKPKFSSNNSSSAESSSDDSSSDDSSSEDDDAAKAKKTSAVMEKDDIDVVGDVDLSEDDETNCIDSVFSLSNLIGKVRSTHSPGGPSSNLSQHQPSPRNHEVLSPFQICHLLTYY